MQVTSDFNICIKGSRASLKQSEGIVAERAKALESHWGYAAYYEKLPELYARAVGDAMPQERSEDYVLSMSFSEDYTGPFALILNEINSQIPELAIAVLAEYGYDEGTANATHFSPSGSNKLDADKEWESAPLPEEEWIPMGWRHPGGAPYCHAKIELTPMGQWGAEETAALKKALYDRTLVAALGFKMNEGSPVVPNGEGYYLDIVGGSELGADLEYLEWLLSDYRSARKPAYSAFCKAMFDKRLVLHLELESKHNSNYYWMYGNHSKTHFMISSDGENLIAVPTWCATYEVSGSHSSDAPILYKLVTDDDFYDLPDSVQYMVERSFRAYLTAKPCPTLSRYDDFDYGDDEDYDDEGDEDREPNEVALYAQAHKDALLALIQKAATVKARVAPKRFIPENFDRRFFTRRFFVKGIFDGYTEAQIKEIAHEFGGAVIRKASGTDYFVYGASVGTPFITGLKNNVPFISADYFEDMTK